MRNPKRLESVFYEVSGSRSAAPGPVEGEAPSNVVIHPALRRVVMHTLGKAQMGFYGRVLQSTVTGREFIPHDRNTIVAANHASHLDMGLTKYALGSYGRGIVSVAARDYFFEGSWWRKAYFENFTNLLAFDRGGSLRAALRQMGDLLDRGKTILIFPEGTRSTDGRVHDFKPAVGYLSLQHQVDILPVWLGGTGQALPKGASFIRRRDVTARIGLPLRVTDLARLTRGLRVTEAARAATALCREAVLELERGGVLDISKLAQP